MINDYMSLSSRSGFNKSVGHVRLVNGIVQQMNAGVNLADIVDELEKGKEVEKAQIGPILNAIVMDREGYASTSFNMRADLQDFDRMHAELEKWNRLQIIIGYHHPQLGITLINPRQRSHWESVREMNREELVVAYVKAIDEQDRKLEQPALEQLRNVFSGLPVSGTEAFGGAVARPAPAAAKPAPAPAAPRPAPRPAAAPAAPAAAAPEPEAAEAAAPASAPAAGGKRKVTPKYGVQVTNELFHNGNVEAWKNIVESYKSKYPALEVHIFHDGQKVNNINSLFKWGKVKHGDSIVFCVSGEDIKGVAKLQRYLFEGASIRYSNYLKKDVNKILNLF